MSQLFLYAIPVFIVTMLLEALVLRGRSSVTGYRGKDSAANISMGLGYLAIATALRGALLPVYQLVYEHRLVEPPQNAWWFWLALLLCDDFCFYWFHRAGHEVRLFWASHVNHHSSQTYNLSTALRQCWLSPVLGVVFWLPMPLLGFDPLHMVTMQAISMLYQYGLHTELVNKLPAPIEWIFNTPSHHRVHHGKDARYLDRNHGGILIVWDRLFGTFEPEVERPTYGLTENIHTYNPVIIAFHELAAMVRDVWRAKTLRGKLGYVFGPPGWREDGSGKTSAELRRLAAPAPAAREPVIA